MIFVFGTKRCCGSVKEKGQTFSLFSTWFFKDVLDLDEKVRYGHSWLLSHFNGMSCIERKEMLFRSFRFKFPFSISFFSIIFPLFNPRSRGTITVRTTTWRFEMGTQKAAHCWADSVVMTNPMILNPVPTSSGWSLCLTVLSTRLDLLLISSKVRWTFLLYGFTLDLIMEIV